MSDDSTWIRIFRMNKPPERDQELLFNTSVISKIEVIYMHESGWRVALKDGLTNPEMVRTYKVYIGNDDFMLPADRNDPVTQVLDEIYKNAIKGPEAGD